MMKFIVVLASVALVVNNVQATLIEEVQEALNAKRYIANEQVCKDIYKLWWKKRENLDSKVYSSANDQLCSVFTGSNNACNYKLFRSQSNISAAQADQECIMLGGHSDKCIANPCTGLQDGTCTIQDTLGLCVYYNGKDVKKINKFYSKKRTIDNNTGKTKTVTKGCNLNPCTQPGYESNREEACRNGKFDNPSVKCDYCRGQGKLKGTGIGCQANTATSSASCKKLSTKAYPKSCIWQKKSNHDCQCCDLYSQCKDNIDKDQSKLPIKQQYERAYPGDDTA